jgi:outer membrane autotransporter protein
MPAAITATSIIHVTRRTPWRELLFVTASVVALASAPPPAAALEECGPTAATVTCPVDAVGPDYPNGVTYEPAADFTLNIEDGVSILGPPGVTVTNSAGNGVINAPNVNTNGLEIINNGDGSASVTAGGTINASEVRAIHAITAGAGAASAVHSAGTLTMSVAGTAVLAEATGAGDATASSAGDIVLSAGGIGVSAITTTGAAQATSTGTISNVGATGHSVTALSTDGTATASGAAVTMEGDGFDAVNATSTSGAAEANGTGAISTNGATSRGVAALSTSGAATANATDVTTAGETSDGVFASSAELDATATATGTVSTAGATSRGVVAEAPLGAASANAAAVTTTGDDSIGVSALSTDGSASANATGAITTGGLNAHGAQAMSTAGDAAVSVADVTTTGDNAMGANAISQDGAASVTATGAISTEGATAIGVNAVSVAGDVTVDVADVTTTGDASTGVFAQSDTGAVNVTTGLVSTAGADTNAIQATSTSGLITIDAGGANSTGENANGIVATSDADINLTVSGPVSGGWTAAPDPLLGTGAVLTSAANVNVEVAAGGSLGSLADSALTAEGLAVNVINNGDIVGVVNLTGDTIVFDNLSSTSFDLRSFSDTDGDGVRDTERVAISNFTATTSADFNNTGSLVLMNVAGATTIDPAGALLPEIGDPLDYDITLEGVEQGQLVGLSTFSNAGAIIMQDALAGGAGPVAGDVLVITGGQAGPANFISNGGTLALDTVLNEGGAAASLSDVLMLDMTTLGTGATALSIANAGGAGTQTIEDGILVVDVADPEASAADAFALNDFVIAGAWQYQLYQGGDAAAGGDPLDGNWYLRSNISPTTDIYRAVPGTLTRFSRTAVGTLQQRLGNRWWRVPETQVERTVTDPAPPPPPAQTREFVVFFDWDKYDIRPDAASVIQQAAEYAKSGNAARIVVVGHTDTSGPEDYNMALSDRRAQAVSNALQSQGVAAQVIGMEWLGETQPAIDTGDGVREERNRRAYIQVDVPGMAAGPSQPRTRTVMETVPASIEIQGSGVWGRIVGAEGEYNRDDDLASADEDMWMAQAGVDFLVHEDETSRLIAGFSIHYGEVSTDVSNTTLGELGSIDSEGTGVSGSLTYYSESGLYMDGVLSYTWFDTDIDSDLFGGPLASDSDATAWVISGEIGKRMPFSEGSNYYWVPQGQLIYTSPELDGFTDPFGAVVEDEDPDSLVGRLGVAIEYLNRTTGDDGSVTRVQGYGIFNLLYEFLDPGGAVISGIELDQDGEDFWGEFGAGFTYSFNEQWSVYGEGLYRTAWEDFGDSYNLQGSLGLRYNW